MASVKVAVRSRPLSKREMDSNAKLILRMDNNTTTLYNPKRSRASAASYGSEVGDMSAEKYFGFDHCYWSTDEISSEYATQSKLYKDLGSEVVENALLGYNACVFAYGQTGAGKTYTMTGSDDEPGLIPRICEPTRTSLESGTALFSKLNQEDVMSYRLEASYMEIYNEQVRDLLKTRSSHRLTAGDASFLRIREHPKDGPFVQDLTIHPFSNYKSIETLMELGNSLRVTASTLMNDTSSRSHAILKIKLIQAKICDGMPSETISHINLVDLAGSERASASGAIGLRLKEGGNINKSLVTLGLVISVLAERSNTDGKKFEGRKSGSLKQIFVPYRDSSLTWLLKDSLGGNSKTIMIATVSPADINYGETLSTLRYASRARKIVNKPVVNEDPNVKIIRELRAEIHRLRDQMNGSQQPGETSMTYIDEKMAAKLLESQQKADELTKTWMHKWKETQQIFEERCLSLRKCGSQTFLSSQKPHLVCLDGDPLSTDVILYHLEEGKTTIGSAALTEDQAIALEGSGIDEEHCFTFVADHHVTIKSLSKLCYVNNRILAVGDTVQLKQSDVVQFGHYLKFRFNNPGEAAVLRKQRRSGHYASMPNLNRSSDSGLGSPEDLERAESFEYLHASAVSPERPWTQTPSDLSCIPDEEEDFHWKQEQIEKQNKELEDRRELLRGLMQQYRDAELTRIEAETARLKEIEEEATSFEKQKCEIEQERVALMKQLKVAHHSLNLWKVKRRREKDKKRRLIEQEIGKLMTMKRRGSSTSSNLERDMRKRKFQLKSKIEEYWKRMDLYENVLLQNELENQKQTSCVALQDTNISGLLLNDDNDVGQEKPVMNGAHDNNFDMLAKLREEEDAVRKLLESRLEFWDCEIKSTEKVMEDKKSKQASVLEECDKVIQCIDGKMESLDRKYREECSEIRLAIQSARNMGMPLGDVEDIHNSRLASAEAEYKVTLEKLKTNRENVLTRTKRNWDKLEQEIQAAEKKQFQLSADKDKDIEEVSSNLGKKMEDIAILCDNIPSSNHVNEINDNIEFNDDKHNQACELERYRQDLLDSKAAIKELLASVFQDNDNLTNPVKPGGRKSNSWSACLELADVDYEASIDSVVSCGTNDLKISHSETVSKHVDVLMIEDRIASAHVSLKTLAEKQLQKHNEIAESCEKQRKILNNARLKEKEKIAENMEKLISSTTDSDHVARYLSLEEKKMTEFQQHLDELETRMLNKMAEGKRIEEQLCHANVLVAEDEMLDSCSSMHGVAAAPVQDVDALKGQKQMYDGELLALREQIEQERKEYMDTLNDQEEYEVIGQEYQEIRQLTFQVQSHVAISEVLRQVYHVSNMVDMNGDHLRAAKHLQFGGWRYFDQNKGVTVFSKHESSKLASFVGCGLIKAKPQIVFNTVRNPSSRFIYDSLLRHMNILEHVSDALKIVYMRHEARVCFLKQARDFCCLHVERMEGERYVVASQSVEHPDCMKCQGVMRAHILPSGWVVEPVTCAGTNEQWSLVWYMIRIDIGNDVSDAVTKYLSSRLPYSIAYLRDYLVMR